MRPLQPPECVPCSPSSKACGRSSLVISQLVRFAITQIAMAANWELLQSCDLTDEHLAALQRGWMELEFVQAAEDALAMDRALAENTIGEMRSSGPKFRSTLALGGGGPSFSSDNWPDRL